MLSPIIFIKSQFRCACLGVVLSLCTLAPTALAQGSAPRGMSGMGSLVIHVMSVGGAPVPIAQVTLYTDIGESTGNNVSRRQEGDGYYYQFSGVLPGRYVIDVTVPGFQESKQTVELTNANLTEAVMFYLKPVGSNGDTPAAPAYAVFTPKAQKETQNALKDLQSKKFESAQKHLKAALLASPGNSQINFLLGMTYVWMKQEPEGKPYLEKALSLDPKHLDSLLALGNLRYRDGDYAGAIELLEKAVQISPTAWQPHLTLADAYLHLEKFSPAREHAERAFELGREKATGAQLLEAEALAGLGENQQAATVLKSYLQAHPEDPNAEKLRGWITELERPVVKEAPISTPMPALPLVAAIAPPGDTLPAPPSTRDTWGPPDSDASVPPVVAGKVCSLPKVLSGAGKRAEELITHLEQFSALERYESVEIRGKGQVSEPTTAAFDYMVFIHHPRPEALNVEEIRQQNRKPVPLPGQLQDLGSPAMVLIFDPQYQSDFEMKCEGLGQWNGQATWLVHFQQRPDTEVRIRKFVTDQREYPMRLRGRAWISAESFQVLHLETDLLQPVQEVQLRREHMSIDYQLVPFPKSKRDLWLPEQVDTYVDFKGHFYHHYHKFTDFKLNIVDVKDKVSRPK